MAASTNGGESFTRDNMSPAVQPDCWRGSAVPGREVRERLVVEVTDDELDLGVLAVLGIDFVHRPVRLVINA